MRTPGHAVLNLAILAPPDSAAAFAVLAGAVAPDVPIACLYLWQRLRGTPTEEIWRTHYQKPPWLLVIHLAHSLPLGALAAGVAVAAGAPLAAWFFASLVLHAVLDLPVHHADAHRHFLPLSQWRFISPLSYWDVRRHGRAVTAAEWAGVAVASYLVMTRQPEVSVGAAALVLGLLHLGYAFAFARLWRSPELAR